MSTKSETHLQQSENFRQQDQQVSQARYEKDKNFHVSIYRWFKPPLKSNEIAQSSAGLDDPSLLELPLDYNPNIPHL